MRGKGIQKNPYFCFIHYAKAFDCMEDNKLWEILKEMGIPDITCLLRNLYAGQEATETDMEQWTGSKMGKEVHQGNILSSCLINLHIEYIM